MRQSFIQTFQVLLHFIFVLTKVQKRGPTHPCKCWAELFSSNKNTVNLFFVCPPCLLRFSLYLYPVLVRCHIFVLLLLAFCWFHFMFQFCKLVVSNNLVTCPAYFWGASHIIDIVQKNTHEFRFSGHFTFVKSIRKLESDKPFKLMQRLNQWNLFSFVHLICPFTVPFWFIIR